MGGGSVVPILDAKDGLDSVEKLQSAERSPSLFLVDIEMRYSVGGRNVDILEIKALGAIGNCKTWRGNSARPSRMA
ncbi:hypothetical protein LBMAG52_32940 [Planctomycetia bacterium]|nr:hypothetical protein LBMAG52_32940 [Planctomycetia bacterium]